MADGRKLLSSTVLSQIELHQQFGGVVPEVAARKHLETVNLVIDEAVAQSGLQPLQLSGVAFTAGPGLIGTLLTGASAAKAFAWADRKDTAWFGVLMAALLPSLLMLWSYTTATGLTVFTYLVSLTVVTVAIPYLFSACAQLTYLVSRRRRVQGWAMARDLTIAGAGVLFSMWVTFAAGYQAVYQALVIVLAGVIVYAFLKAQRERVGRVSAPADNPPLEPSPGTGR